MNEMSILFGGVAILSSNCVTIDSANDPALNDARIAFPGASRHNGTQQATGNLSSCLSGGGTGMIVGHGLPGFVVTSFAGPSNPPNDFMDLQNMNYWGRIIAQLRGKIGLLKFLSCDVGAEDVGADFLYAIARLTNAPTMAPTGLVNINSSGQWWLQPGATWQMATPTNRPPIIHRPSGILILEEAMNTCRNSKGEEKTVSRIDFYAGYSRARPTTTWRGKNVGDILRLIRFDQPVPSDSSLLAMPTGLLVLTFGEDSGVQENEVFIIYANRVLHNQRSRTYFYAASSLENVLMMSAYRATTVSRSDHFELAGIFFSYYDSENKIWLPPNGPLIVSEAKVALVATVAVGLDLIGSSVEATFELFAPQTNELIYKTTYSDILFATTAEVRGILDPIPPTLTALTAGAYPCRMTVKLSNGSQQSEFKREVFVRHLHAT